MKNISYKNLILSYIFLLFCSLAFAQDTQLDDYLRKYNQSVDRYDNVSISYKLITFKEQENGISYKKNHLDYTYRRQNEKAEWIGGRLWEDRTTPLAGQGVILDGKRDILTTQPNYKVQVSINPSEKNIRDNLLFQPEHGSVLSGKIYGNGCQSISELLKNSENIKVEPSPVNICGMECRLIHGDTKYGYVSLWVAPEMGFEALKWEIEKGKEHLLEDKPLGNTELSKWIAKYQVDEITKDDLGTSYIKKVTFTLTTNPPKGLTVYNYKYDITDVDYNPNFEKLNSFTLKSLNLPDGTLIIDSFAPGIEYQWFGGNIVPIVDRFAIDELEKTVGIVNNVDVQEAAPGILNTDIAILDKKNIESAAADTTEDHSPEASNFLKTEYIIIIIFFGVGALAAGVLFIRSKGKSEV